MRNLSESFALFASLLPAVCGTCYGIMLVFNRESKAKRMLGVILLISGFCWGVSTVMDNLYQQHGQVPIANTWYILSNLMLWPVIGWYLTLLFRPDATFYPYHFRQFLPFLTAIPCILIIKMVSAPVPDIYSIKDFISRFKTSPEIFFRVVMLMVFLTQTTYFYIRANKDLGAYQKRIRDDFSETDKVDLRWVRGINFMCFFAAAVNLTLAFSADIRIRMWLAIGAFFYLGVLAILGGMQKEIYYLPDPGISMEKQKVRNGNVALFVLPEQDGSKIPEVVYTRIRDGLTDLLENKEVYCKPNLRLDDLASMLGTNKTYVSAILKEHFQSNFYTLINNYRVKKACKLLCSSQVQVKDVWEQAGFNSQTAFNSLFKRTMQMTPSEWVKTQAEQQIENNKRENKYKRLLND